MQNVASNQFSLANLKPLRLLLVVVFSVFLATCNRESNVACLAPDTSDNGILSTETLFEFEADNIPLAMKDIGNNQALIITRTGNLYLGSLNAAGLSTPTLLGSISDKLDTSSEGGLLGLAISPNFASDSTIYLSYTEDDGILNPIAGTSIISRFKLNSTSYQLDLASEQKLLSLTQPFPNHNGGNIAFGHDDFLYIGFGDGGFQNDPSNNAQNLNTWLGSLLRIDVSNHSLAGYTVPASNPFVNQADKKGEIFAYGLRNPWRWTFDKDNGSLWLGDVGQDAYEEVNIITNGGNYGWKIREGAHCVTAGCDSTNLIDPVYDYAHDENAACDSITGGYVYRGANKSAFDAKISGLAGNDLYLFSDACSGHIQGLIYDGTTTVATDRLFLNLTLGAVVSFAEDNQGEQYILTAGDKARISKITISSDSTPANTVASKLSETGCYADTAKQQVAEGVIFFNVNSPLWSDGADKKRYFAIPDESQIAVESDGDLTFPAGSVLIKNFYHNKTIVETRLFMNHKESGWKGYSYEWNDDLSDAILLDDELTKPIDASYTHYYPSQEKCASCHTPQAGFSLGLELPQLERKIKKEGKSVQQLDYFNHLGLFENHVNRNDITPLSPLTDSSATLDHRVRSYLHSNCTSCHRPGASLVDMDLRITTALNDANICDVVPSRGNVGLVNPKIVAPGNPESSVLVKRMEDLGDYRMPPIASHVVDQLAVDSISTWITNLNSCE